MRFGHHPRVPAGHILRSFRYSGLHPIADQEDPTRPPVPDKMHAESQYCFQACVHVSAHVCGCVRKGVCVCVRARAHARVAQSMRTCV